MMNAIPSPCSPSGTSEYFSFSRIPASAISAIAQPYRFYLLQRVQALYNGFSAQERTAVEQMLASCDLSEILTLKLDRELERNGNLEVWL